MAKNIDFTFWGWFFFVVVKKHQKSMFEFNLESVFLSHFFQKRFYFADFPEDTLKTCHLKKNFQKRRRKIINLRERSFRVLWDKFQLLKPMEFLRSFGLSVFAFPKKNPENGDCTTYYFFEVWPNKKSGILSYFTWIFDIENVQATFL